MTENKYKTLVDRFEHPAGTTCYPCRYYEYGCARDDSMNTGVHHRSMTVNPSGDYPFFTIAEDDLEYVGD